jgi:hypothetical protein
VLISFVRARITSEPNDPSLLVGGPGSRLVPVDRPVGADERSRVEIANQAVLGDGQVARLGYSPSSAGDGQLCWTNTGVARYL